MKTVSVTVSGDDDIEPDETVTITLSNPVGGAIRAGGGTGTGTIRNDDFPEVSIDSPGVAEGASGSSTALVFTVVLDRASFQEVTVDYGVGGTATAGVDYVMLPGGMLRFAPGETVKTVEVSVTGDNLAESDETVVLTLSNATGGAGIRTAVGTGTVRDDDPLELVIDSPSVREGDSGETVTLVFAVTMVSESSGEVTVDYGVTGGTATAGVDYVALSGGTISFATGETSKTISVTVRGDGEAERDDETVEVTLSNPTGGATLRTAVGTGTIIEDDLPELSISSPEVTEGDTGTTAALDFTVTLSASWDEEVTVAYGVGGTATAGTDFLPLAPGTLTFAAGETVKAISVTVSGDDEVEPDETVTITLSNPVGGTIRAGGGTGTGTIRNDDFPEVSIDSPSVAEGASGSSTALVFTVELDRASFQEVTVDYGVGGTATAGVDYVTLSGGTLRFAAGEIAKTVEVSVTGDNLAESDETVVLTLSNATGGAGIRTAVGTGTVRDDDPLELVIESPNVAEGDSGETATLAFTVTMVSESSGEVTVDYGVTGGTATAGVDYVALSGGTLSFAAGETVKTVPVTVRGDGEAERDETVVVTLSNPTGGATLRTAVGTGTIIEDDLPELSISSPEVTESNAGTTVALSFTVTLSASWDEEVTVDYGAGGTATAGTDFQPLAPGTLRFAVGETVKTVSVTVSGDDEVEPDETVTITLSNPVGGTIRAGGGTGTGTIRNDDFPELSIDSPGVDEGASGSSTALVFTVEMDRASFQEVTVDYGVGGTATAGVDYVTLSGGTLRFAPGETTRMVEVSVTGDNLSESDETVVLTLSNATGGAGIRTAVGTGTVRDDDPLELVIDSPSVGEGDSGETETLEFTVTMVSESSGEVMVDYGVTGGTATAGVDYVALSGGTLRFAAGETAKTVPVTVRGDGEAERDETVVVTLSNPTGGATLRTAVGTGTIIEDDLPELSIDSPEVTEGDTGTTAALDFTVTLSASWDEEVTVDYRVATESGTASTGEDYAALYDRTLRFAVGETSKTIVITVIGDGDIERDETVVIALSAPHEATIGTGTGTGTIRNDDQSLLSVDSPGVVEGASGSSTALVFVVELDRASFQEVTVDYGMGGTATNGVDYGTLTGGTLRFAPGETVKTVEVAVTGDNLAEADETVVLTLSNPTGGAGMGVVTGTGTISDDDRLTLSIDSPSVSEGASGTTALVFTVTMLSESSDEVMIDYGVTGGTATAGEDYVALSDGTLSFAAGETSKTITVMVRGDGVPEADKTVVITLSNPTGGGRIERERGTGSILEDDLPMLSVAAPGAVDEGAAGARTPLEFTVTLSAPWSEEVTVDYTLSGRATRGIDYETDISNTLRFVPGETSKPITVMVTGDDFPERDESVAVTLRNPNNATIRKARETGTIRNDDYGLSINSPTVDEGAAGAVTNLRFKVRLNARPSVPVTVGYRVFGGTAEAGPDYQPFGDGTVTFAPGQIAKGILVRVIGDDVVEPDETVVVVLQEGTPGATIRSGTGIGTIRNDDYEFSISSAEVSEGAPGRTTPLVFTVTVDPPSPRPVTVDYAVTSDGSADFGADYQALAPGTLTFGAGETSKTIEVRVIGDDVNESDETVEIELSSPGGATIRSDGEKGVGTIRNDDRMVSIDSPTVMEGESGVTTVLAFTVRVNRPTPHAVEIVYTIIGGTATPGEDYEEVVITRRIVIPAFATSATIPVEVKDDDLGEDSETVVIQLAEATNATIMTSEGTGTIVNDDPALVIDSPSVIEGGTGDTQSLEFTVTLDPPARSAGVTVGYRVAGGTAEAGVDYEGPAGNRLTFAAGESSKTIPVTVRGDLVAERDETVNVVLSASEGARIVTATGTGTIRNDDSGLVIDSPTVAEGASGTVKPLEFTVTLEPPLSRQVTVDYGVMASSGTATLADGDYQALADGRLSFAPNETAKTIAVMVNGDDAVEPDETVVVRLSSSTGATIVTDTGTGKIRNDDHALSINSPRTPEGTTGRRTPFEFTVTLEPPSGQEVTVDYAVSGGSATGSDYLALGAKTLTFMPGETSLPIPVMVIGDDNDEVDETIEISLANPVGATIRTQTGVGTIQNDEIELLIDSQRVASGTLEFSLTLNRPSREHEVMALYTIAIGDSATGGNSLWATAVDPLALTPRRTVEGMVTFLPDESRKDVSVPLTPEDRADLRTLSVRGVNAKDADPYVFGSGRNASTARSRSRTKALTHVLAGIGRTVATNIVNLIWDRAEDHRSGPGGSYAVVGGRALDTGAFVAGNAEGGDVLRAASEIAGIFGIDLDSSEAVLRNVERRLASGRGVDAFREWVDLPDDRDLIGKTRFGVAFDGDLDDGHGGTLALWGRGNLSTFKSRLEGGDFTAEGDVLAGHLGLDYRFGEDLLAGVVVSRTEGDVDYSESGGKGNVATDITSAHPYLHWMSPFGFDTWGTVGYGEGTAEIKDGDGSVETDLAMQVAAGGVRSEFAHIDKVDLAIKADVFVSRISTEEVARGGSLEIEKVNADSSRVRLALEGGGQELLANGALLAGNLEFGARLDGGDAEQGVGADIGAGLRYSVPHMGLDIKGRGSLLLVHEENGFGEWGLGLGLTYDPGVRGRGIQFSFEPSWRAPTSNAAASMWNAAPGAAGWSRMSPNRNAVLDVRLGYGAGVLEDRALATVFGELGGTDGGSRIRLGAELRQMGGETGGLSLELYGERQDRQERPDHSIMLKGRLGF